jgi:hypothetical protein
LFCVRAKPPAALSVRSGGCIEGRSTKSKPYWVGGGSIKAVCLAPSVLRIVSRHSRFKTRDEQGGYPDKAQNGKSPKRNTKAGLVPSCVNA